MLTQVVLSNSLLLILVAVILLSKWEKDDVKSNFLILEKFPLLFVALFVWLWKDQGFFLILDKQIRIWVSCINRFSKENFTEQIYTF